MLAPLPPTTVGHARSRKHKSYSARPVAAIQPALSVAVPIRGRWNCVRRCPVWRTSRAAPQLQEIREDAVCENVIEFDVDIGLATLLRSDRMGRKALEDY